MRHGIDPECKAHRHASRSQVLILTSGGKHYPWRAEDLEFNENNAPVDFRWKAIGDMAILADGSLSTKHVVIRDAREWRIVGGVNQLVPIGSRGRSTGNKFKTHCKPPRAPRCKVIK